MSFSKKLRIPATEDGPEWQLGTVDINEDGITWRTLHGVIFKASWEHWALMMTHDPRWPEIQRCPAGRCLALEKWQS